jgi:hypothetical protein
MERTDTRTTERLFWLQRNKELFVSDVGCGEIPAIVVCDTVLEGFVLQMAAVPRSSWVTDPIPFGFGERNALIASAAAISHVKTVSLVPYP